MTGSNKHAHNGFTLVEVLIAMALTAGLLAGLWNILGIFTSLQSRSELYVGHARIKRGLIQQIQDDLDQVVVAPQRRRRESESFNFSLGSSTRTAASLTTTGEQVDDAPAEDYSPEGKGPAGYAAEEYGAGNRAADSTSLALRGNSNWMMMDLRPSHHDSDAGRDRFSQSRSSFSSGDVAKDRLGSSGKRVLYYFVSPELALVENTLKIGLTRWEIPTSIPVDELVQELNEGKFGTANSRLWEQFSQADRTDPFASSVIVSESLLSGDPADRFDVPREYVPEVERMLIRYSGEFGWSSSWNSDQQSLPTAIEFLVIWNDPWPIRAKELATHYEQAGTLDQTRGESKDQMDIDEKLDQAKLLAAWERLGTEDISAAPQKLPRGFARYLFCLPSAPLLDRGWVSLAGEDLP